MIGRSISRYRILEKLGEGGMGVVYKAEDTKLKRIVALKFLSRHSLGTEEERRRFTQEAQAAAALDHPSICTVYEIDEVDGQAFISMAYVDGMSLRERLASEPLELDEALELAIQIGEGLQAAHERGIVHRDIKPGNILLTSGGRVRIADFGLAKLIGRTAITRSGTTLGTVSYMSPEQARGEPVDQRSDIWSLAAVLYEMLTGRPPFDAERDHAVVHAILNRAPEPASTLRAGLPTAIDRILHKALAKEPERRYARVGEMLEHLRQISSIDESAPTESYLSPAHWGRAGRGRASRAALVGGALAVILILGLIVYRMVEGEKVPRERLPIAVLDFRNETDEKELDGLSGLLITALEQSRRLSVLTRAAMFDLLEQLQSQARTVTQTRSRATWIKVWKRQSEMHGQQLALKRVSAAA